MPEILPWTKLNIGVPPQLSNVSAPDSITLPASAGQSYILSVTVTDEDNNNDVNEVFFNTTKPDGSPSSGNPFFMYDDGKNGDQLAGDGIWSFSITIPHDRLMKYFLFLTAIQITGKKGLWARTPAILYFPASYIHILLTSTSL